MIPGLESVFTNPALPLRQGPYRSALRDERLAAWLGAALGICFGVCFVTGLYSHVQQHPLSWLAVPARPAGLYRITQGVHVISGIASVPVLVAKLWVVWPRFLSWPPFRVIADVVERLGLVALVGGGVFMAFSGVANTAQWYPWHFSFTASHYWVAWVTVGAIIAHVGAKWAVTTRALGRRGGGAGRPALADADEVLGSSSEGTPQGLTRRGFLGVVAAASGALTLATAGETIPVLAPIAVLAPRDPRQQPVNRSAANAGVVTAAMSPEFRLVVSGRVARPLSLDLAGIHALPRSSSVLPIACVEGWSYSARWDGVRLRDLLALAGAPAGAAAMVASLERGGPYRTSFVNHFQARDPATLLATHLDGRPLTLDHGYPLRLIAPDRAGVLQTKWVTEVVAL